MKLLPGMDGKMAAWCSDHCSSSLDPMSMFMSMIDSQLKTL